MIPTTDLGAAASATYGGLFAARLVGVFAPMVLVDIRSTYPSMFSLLGLTPLYSCAAFTSVDVPTARFVEFLAHPERLRSRGTWAQWGLTFAIVRPHGEPLPVMADRGDHFALSVAGLDLAGAQGCWHWTDIAAAVCRGAIAQCLDVVRVFRIDPVGTMPGLRALRLLTGCLVDLTRDDLGAVLVAERARLKTTGPRWLESQLKAVGNALTYGLLARADAKPSRVGLMTAFGPHGAALTAPAAHVETPGPHAFLAGAAAVAAAARLVVAMVEADITGAGGLVAAVHADSFAVVCGEGDPHCSVPVLSAPMLVHLLDRYASLGIEFAEHVPVDAQATGLVVGVNRVVFAGRGDKTVMVRSSDAGLGGYLADPSDTPGERQADGRWSWAATCETALFSSAHVPASDGIDVDASQLPDWAHRPVVRRHRANTWTTLCALRAASGDPSVGPFAHYLRADGGPVTVGRWPDARRWGDADWRLDGHPIGLDTYSLDGTRHQSAAPTRAVRATVPSVASYLARWANPPQPTSTGPRRGPQAPTPVRSAPGLIEVVGKDGPSLVAAEGDPYASRTTTSMLIYGTTSVDLLRDQVRQSGIRAVAKHAGLAFETVRRWATHEGEVSRHVLITIADAAHHLSTVLPPKCALAGCARPARPRSMTCSEAHRKAHQRSRSRRRLSSDDAVLGGLATCLHCGTKFVNEMAAQRHECLRAGGS